MIHINLFKKYSYSLLIGISLLFTGHIALLGQTIVAPGFDKEFMPATIGIEGTSTLTFTIDNTDNTVLVEGLSFTDPLPAGLAIANPANASTTCNGGTISAPGAGTVISYSGGSVDASSSCTLSVNVTGNALYSDQAQTQHIDIRDNTSGNLLYEGDVGGQATATLTVSTDRPGFNKSFVPSLTAPGGTSRLTFNIDNTANDGSSGSLEFSDELPAGLVIATPANIALDTAGCGGGTFTAPDGGTTINFSGGPMAAGSNCSMSLDVTAATIGTYNNISSELISSGEVSSGFATSQLRVIDPLFLTKSFINDPVNPGDLVTLEFTLLNFNGDATVGRDFGGATVNDIAFSDDLSAVLPGTPDLIFSSSGPNSCGGTIGGVTTSNIDFTGGTLEAGDSCSFRVNLLVPTEATPGNYTNTTTTVSGNDGDLSGNAATDVLTIAAPDTVSNSPVFSKSFALTSVAPGNTVDLTFQIKHKPESPGAATAIAFTDDLGAFVTGAEAVQTIGNTCGGTLTIGSTVELMNGGPLANGDECAITVRVAIPAGTPSGLATNTTSTLSSLVDGTTVTGGAATADLTISTLRLTKEFTDDPAIPGSTVNLQFTLQNIGTSADDNATSIRFSDDLDAALDGLAGNGVKVYTACSIGDSITWSAGNTVLTFRGGTVNFGEQCTFDVELTVPIGTFSDTYINRTSDFTAVVDGSLVSLENATAPLIVDNNFITLTKEFTNDPANPGGTTNLKFTLTNTSTEGISNIAFTDDLNAALTGLVATGFTNNSCIVAPTGTSTISFSGGTLLAGTSCSFDASLSVPASALNGSSYANTTSSVTGTTTVGGLAVVGDPATDNLNISAITTPRDPPNADAGPDQTVECGTDVNLDGSNSSSPNSAITKYTWTEGATVLGMGPTLAVSLSLGEHTITLTVEDLFGSDSDEVVITIEDTTPPMISCPANVEVCEGDDIDLGSPTVSDDCDPNPSVGNNAPANFSVGITQVTWTATDASGNTNTCIQTVTVHANPTVSIASSELPEFCQGAVLVLTASPSAPGTFLWSTNETTESIEVAPTGTYSVVFTDENTCTATDEIVLAVNPKDLLSSYIILSQEDVKLDHDQVVLNGGVGVFQVGKKIVVDHNSMLTAPSTFAIASLIEIKHSSIVSNPIIGQPTVTLPPFKPNIMSGGSDVKVPKNTTMTLNLSLYKKVEVDEGGTAIFTQPTVYMETLILKKNSSAEVADCSEFIVKSDFKVDEDCTFNAASNNITVYCKKGEVKKRSKVTADIYATDEVKADGEVGGPPILMTGFFIGKKVTGDHNVIWDWNTDCECNTSSSLITEDNNVQSRFITSASDDNSVKIFSDPNPFSQDIRLHGELLPSQKPATLVIVNLQQQELYRKTITNDVIDESINASEWVSGVYFLMVITENDIKTVKLLKTN